MLGTIAAISLGAALGALARWGLSAWLNAVFPAIPPGTVAANFIGAYIIGVAMAFFASNPALAPHWRMFIITGFCGGLTTFSTFSAELTSLLQQQRMGLLASAIVVHVGGSVLLTLLGMATYMGLRR